MTKIEWANRTWNPVTGCTRVSEGCDHCYMHRMYPRLKGFGTPGYSLEPDMIEADARQAGPAHAVEKARKNIRLLDVGFLPQRHFRLLPGPDVQGNDRSGHGTGAHFHGAHEETRHCPVMVEQPPATEQQRRLLAPEYLARERRWKGRST